ncbi:methyltransferase domain-containing protein [bacterium]|nr:methyltransferase domain-containing protein [bacterium]
MLLACRFEDNTCGNVGAIANRSKGNYNSDSFWSLRLTQRRRAEKDSHMARLRTVEGNWYDYPEYYDIAFRSDTKREANFIEKLCQKYLKPKAASNGHAKHWRFLEPACGSGRLVIELARRGHDVVAYDLCEPMVQFVKERVAKKKLRANVFAANMVDYRLPKKADAAFNLINTFRHLNRTQAVKHLQAVADSLKPGGIYILGIILIPEDTTEEEAFERWTETHRNTKVTVTITVPELNVPKRWEIMRTSMTVRNGRDSFKLVTDSKMQLYTPDDMRKLFKRVPDLEVMETYDFWYDVRKPEPFDERIGDVVFVLRKRNGRSR